jgi:hypothetical protein
MKELVDQYPNSISFIDGCAIESDYAYITGIPDACDPRETIFSRLMVVADARDARWFYHDIDANVVSVCVKSAGHSGKRLCALSKEGEVEIYSNADGAKILEKIPEAGLRLGSRGYTVTIREIGQSLFVCGANDQVYRRNDGDGSWTLITAKPLKLVSALDPYYSMLSSIDGADEMDVYTCGMHGRLYHFDGAHWKQVPLSTDEHLNCVRCISRDEVWVCGENGTLFVGNHRSGFSDVSSIDDKQSFWSLTKFQGKIFLASTNEGMFAYDGSVIQAVDTGLESGLWTYVVDSTPDVLWSFSPKEIAVFDGKMWRRVLHQDNEPIE